MIWLRNEINKEKVKEYVKEDVEVKVEKEDSSLKTFFNDWLCSPQIKNKSECDELNENFIRCLQKNQGEMYSCEDLFKQFIKCKGGEFNK